jgi:hypothetical protein
VSRTGREVGVRFWKGLRCGSSWGGRLVESDDRRLESRIDGVGGACTGDGSGRGESIETVLRLVAPYDYYASIELLIDCQ